MSEKTPVKERFLDFSDCVYIGEIYAVIKRELELPEWCGENLDALWDSITGIMYTPASIKLKAVTGRKELERYIDDIAALFREAEEKYHEITVTVEK